MSDLIRREDAIEVADAVWTVTGDKNVAKVWDQIKDLPSAQPVAKDINVPCTDTISRQAAIDALSHMMDIDGFRDGYAVSRANVDCMLRSLPPAQPDMSGYSDRLWKLAYERGKRDTYTEMEGAEDAEKEN